MGYLVDTAHYTTCRDFEVSTDFEIVKPKARVTRQKGGYE